MSDFLENAVLQSSLNAVAFPSIPSVFVALFTTATTDAGGGTEVSTSGTGYVRQEITTGWTVTNPTPHHRGENTDLIEFPVATAGWGEITHVAIIDAVTAGNFLYHGTLPVSQIILINQIAQFPSATIAALVGVIPA